MAECEDCGQEHDDEDAMIVAASVNTSDLDDLGILSFEFIIGGSMRIMVGVMPAHSEAVEAMTFVEQGFGELFMKAIKHHKQQMVEAMEKANKAGLN